MASYFGTDGIRGQVGRWPMTPDFVLKLGWAAGRVLARRERDTLLIGKDTRVSGYMMESALEAGLSAAGANILLLGPMPTPGIAYLTRTLRACAGIVISASHNPYEDNGVKFFDANGSKLPDDVEAAIERELEGELQVVDASQLGKAERVVDAAGRYIEFCKSTIPAPVHLHGLRLVVDCAHGATYHVAPEVFEELGADVVRMGAEPNGFNINDRCGATAPGALQQAVLAEGADLGIALDGDGDRLIMVDEQGEVVDGDELLFIMARAKQRDGSLRGGVVGTQMSNLGLEQAVNALDVPFKRVKVGDRYVLEALLRDDWLLGGESSGHIICRDRTTTGDGIVSALQVLYEVVRAETSLHALKQGMTKYPQTMVNVPVTGDADMREVPQVREAVNGAEASLGGYGRVLLRPSGTEPLLRVMVEGPDGARVQALAEEIAAAVSAASDPGSVEDTAGPRSA